MSTIVAGRFDTFAEAERAARGLYGHGFSVWDVSIFTVRAAEPSQALGRPAGVMLAARVEPERLQSAAELIRLEGGRELEQAEGQWENGRWSDFDPLASPQPVQTPASSERAGQLGEGALSATGNEDPGSEIDQSVRRDEPRDAGQPDSGARERDLGALLTPGQHSVNQEGVSKGDQERLQGQRAGEPRQQGGASSPASPSPSSGQSAPGGGTTGSAGGGQMSDQGAQGSQGSQGAHPADEQPREAWESAPSHRQPGEVTSEPELVRGATTTPEPSEPNDTFRQIRRGQFPPGVGEGELRDPGSTTPGAPKVDNRS